MRLYKFRSLDKLEYILDILLNERLYCSTYESLNDPLEGLFYTIINPLGTSKKLRQYKRIDDLPTYTSDLRICSLSNSFKDIQMWSHYANGHTGVAIEIDFENHADDAIKVNYGNGLQKHGTTILAGSTPTDVLSYKTKNWEDEEEYRIITKDSYYPIQGRITAVYFGVKTEDSYKDLLKKSVPQGIKFSDTRLDRKNIVIRPLEDKSS